MRIQLIRAAKLIVLVLFCLALGRAAAFKFQEKEDAIFKACREQLQKMGITRMQAKSKYPTPQVGMVSSGCIVPGGTSEVVVKGSFVAGTNFVFENDNLEVLKENSAANEYRATVKAAPGIGPQSAVVRAIVPVTGLSTTYVDAVRIGGKFEWNMEAGNGWKIKAASKGTDLCGDKYEILFFRKGEANPFEKREATLYHDMYSKDNYRFSISNADQNLQAGQDDMASLFKKMSDPKLTDQQRDALMKQMEKAQEQTMARVKMMSDPAYIKKTQEQQQQFGCGGMLLAVGPDGKLTGELRCSDKVGSRITLTGAMSAGK
jgi:hypothetical protein